MRVKIEVKAIDIKKGKSTMVSNYSCPIARALQRTLKRPNQSSGYYGFTFGDVRIDYPKSALAFQMRGFNNKPLKPFSFTVNIPKDAFSV